MKNKKVNQRFSLRCLKNKQREGMIKAVSLIQIMILIIGTVSIGWALGSEVGEVSGAEMQIDDNTPVPQIKTDDQELETRAITEDEAELDGGRYGSRMVIPANSRSPPPATPIPAIPAVQQGSSNLDLLRGVPAALGQGAGALTGKKKTEDVTPPTITPGGALGSSTGTPTSRVFTTRQETTLYNSANQPIKIDAGTPIRNGRVTVGDKTYTLSQSEVNSQLANGNFKNAGETSHYFTQQGEGGVTEYWQSAKEGGVSTKISENEWLGAQGKDLTTGSGIGDWLANKGGFGLGSANFFGHLVEGAMWGAAAGGIVSMIAGMIGPENSNIGSASFMAVWGGMTAGKGVYGLLKEGGWIGKTAGVNNAGLWSTGIGIGIGVIIFLAMYKETRQEVVEFTCYAWDAPTGGKDCEKCNEMESLYGVPCSEYQCRALGQACELQNVGTGEEICAWRNEHDVEYPTIQPWKGALLEDYVYTPDQTISPPDRGVKVQSSLSTSGKVRPFTALSFGIILNEPGACKIDMLRRDTFEEMSHFIGGSSTLKYNHTETLSLPGPSAAKAANLTIYNGGKYELHVRCQDANGNHNPATFVFTFEVEDGPDTTPPLIVSTSTINGAPIAYNLTEHDVSVYVNEPATCKWSRLDKDYDDMETTMICSGGIRDINAKMLYECSTTLTGLKINEANDYYFRCKDKAEVPNENKESFKFVLMGTRPLVLNEFLPETGDLVKDATNPVKVTFEATTSAGFNDGESICYYSTTGEQVDELEFFETHSHSHKQELWLAEGEYTYHLRCIDLGGNAVSNVTTFDVQSDAEPPVIIRAYHEESYLKIITDEDADCAYSTKDCDYNFDEGIAMTTIGEVSHYTDWDTSKSFYIKCMDKNGRGPEPNNICSIIARPSTMGE